MRLAERLFINIIYFSSLSNSCSESWALGQDYWSPGRQIWTQGRSDLGKSRVKSSSVYSRHRQAFEQTRGWNIRSRRSSFGPHKCQTPPEIADRGERYEHS